MKTKTDIAQKVYLAYRGRPGCITGAKLKALIAKYVAMDDAKLTDTIRKLAMFNHANAVFNGNVARAILAARQEA